jgi:hypothetical protein
MSEQWQKRQTGTAIDDSPIMAYYQFKAVDEDKASEMKPEQLKKIKVLKKDQEFVGTFQHTFVDKEYKNDKGEFVINAHVIKTDNEGKITIKGASTLNAGLAGVPVGTKVKVVYLGKGKARKGRKAPYLFDVYTTPSLVMATTNVTPEELDDQTSDLEDDSEIEF